VLWSHGLVKHYATSHNLTTSPENFIRIVKLRKRNLLHFREDFVYRVQKYVTPIKILLFLEDILSLSRGKRTIEWEKVKKNSNHTKISIFGKKEKSMWLP